MFGGGGFLEKWNKKDEVTSQMAFSVQKTKQKMVVKGIVALLICKMKVVAFLLSDVDCIFLFNYETFSKNVTSKITGHRVTVAVFLCIFFNSGFGLLIK